MRTGRYHKVGQGKGRSWYVMVDGTERPAPGESALVQRRDNTQDVVTIKQVSEGSPGAWICLFQRTNQRPWPNAVTPQPQATVSPDGGISLAEAQESLEVPRSTPTPTPTLASPHVAPDMAQAAQVLQKLFGGVDSAKIEAQVNKLVADTLRDPVNALNLAAQNAVATAQRAEARIDDIPSVVRQLAQSILAEHRSVNVTVTRQDGTVTDVGEQHKDFAELIKLVGIGGINVWLAGPAGTGKTTAARNVAQGLGLPFFFNGAIDTEYKLSGFVDAQGRVISTAFRKAWEQGGVYLFDEVDASMPAALLAFNAALANGHADFPDGAIARHPDFRCIAAANTYGLGANFEYVGRVKLDAAFLDRFVFFGWEIDTTLERKLAGNDAWVNRVQQVRSNVKAKGVKAIISPRASIFGAKMIAAGFDWEVVETMTLRKGMSQEQWEGVQ